jgi:hypothetical protein
LAANSKQKKYISKVFLILILGTPFLLILLPSNYFDSGKSMCLSISLFDRECFGCGITRAIMHLIHFDFSLAWKFNKLSYVILPILILFWIYVLGKLINKKFFAFFDSWY